MTNFIMYAICLAMILMFFLVVLMYLNDERLCRREKEIKEQLKNERSARRDLEFMVYGLERDKECLQIELQNSMDMCDILDERGDIYKKRVTILEKMVDATPCQDYPLISTADSSF